MFAWLTHRRTLPVYGIMLSLLIICADHRTDPYIQFPILFLISDIEQPLTRRNLINLAHILPKQSKDFDLHLVETFNEVMYLTLYTHPNPMNPFKQLENPT